MSVIRIPEALHAELHGHLLSGRGERFAFMHARATTSMGMPVFLVHSATLVPDAMVALGSHGYEVDPDYLLDVVNGAVRSGAALIEAHNHWGTRPRPSGIDRDAYAEFVPYILDSLQGRPYATTVWTASTTYGEYHLADGGSGRIRSITVAGARLRQLVSRDNDGAAPPAYANRQLPWFTPEGQQQLARLRGAIVGAGGTGSHTVQQAVYLGLRDLVPIDRDDVDDTSLNRVVTATPADVGTNKTILARRLARAIAPDCRVDAFPYDLRDPRCLDALKGVDVIFGCVDNDGARLILNELAVAYAIPYFDLGVGINAPDGALDEAGGRVAVVVPGGPCLSCMDEIDRTEARYYLSSPAEQRHARDHGYVTGIDTPTPAVVSLNGTIASVGLTEFSLYLTGVRPISALTELDLLAYGRHPAQWLTPRRVERNNECLTCTYAGHGDEIGPMRYALAD